MMATVIARQRKHALCTNGHDTFSTSADHSDEWVMDRWDSCGVISCDAPLGEIRTVTYAVTTTTRRLRLRDEVA